MRTALYLRDSYPSESAQISLETQEAGCRQWCAEHGAAVVALYREVRTGVDLWERPALQQLLADAQRGAFDEVLFYATDRFSRDPEHLTTLKVMLAAAGVSLACVTEPIAADDAGVLLQFVRGWAAKREWGQIRERTVRGKRARVERGMVPGAGPDRYGWRKDRQAGVRVIHEPEARVVRRIYALADAGVPLAEIARRLAADEVPPPSAGKYQRATDGQWGTGQLRRILRDPSYAGEAWAWRYRWDPVRRVTVERPREEWVRLADGAVPAIVDPGLWERVQARLDGSRGAWTRNRVTWRQYLLRGLVTCACGRPMYAESDGRGHRYYRCASRRHGAPCGAPLLPAGAVEDDVWARVEAFLRDPGVIARARDTLAAPDDDHLEADLATARADLERVTRGMDRLLTAARTSEVITWDLVERQLAAAQRERRAAERRIADFERRRDARALDAARMEALVDWCRVVSANLAGFDFDDRRRTLETLSVRVVADGGAWRVEPPWLDAV